MHWTAGNAMGSYVPSSHTCHPSTPSHLNGDARGRGRVTPVIVEEELAVRLLSWDHTQRNEEMYSYRIKPRSGA